MRSLEEKRRLIEPANPQITISRQCELLELARPSYYYRPRPVSDLNLKLMRRLDEIYTDFPYFGVLKMTACLQNEGYAINHKRIKSVNATRWGWRRFIRNRNCPNRGRARSIKFIPTCYTGSALMRSIRFGVPDITFIPMPKGYVYLIAIMDWYSRYVVAWEVSVTMETEFCLEALSRALRKAQPQIFNSDQGSQFTSQLSRDYY